MTQNSLRQRFTGEVFAATAFLHPLVDSRYPFLLLLHWRKRSHEVMPRVISQSGIPTGYEIGDLQTRRKAGGAVEIFQVIVKAKNAPARGVVCAESRISSRNCGQLNFTGLVVAVPVVSGRTRSVPYDGGYAGRTAIEISRCSSRRRKEQSDR